MTPEIKKAFDFILTNLSAFKLTKQEHMLVEQIVRQAQQLIPAVPVEADIVQEAEAEKAAAIKKRAEELNG